MELWIATGNPGKLKEFEKLLANFGDIKSLKDLPAFTAPPETGKTFFENAKIKAKSLHAVKKDQWVIADDSGLIADGLNGLPGVHSARYAGDNARDVENTAKLLKMIDLRCATNRNAKFNCTIVAYDPHGKEHTFEGTLSGTIARSMRGTNGFGYDNVFIPNGYDKTLAELDMQTKNQISHRANAIKKLSEILK